MDLYSSSFAFGDNLKGGIKTMVPTHMVVLAPLFSVH